MAHKKKEPNRVDDLLDELLEDCHSPEDILGESVDEADQKATRRTCAGR